MSEKFTWARNCFQENLQLFGDAHSEPEKYNLYNGLAALAEALADLEGQVLLVHEELNEVSAALRRRS